MAADAQAPDYRLDWRVSLPGVVAMVGVVRRIARAALRDSPRIEDIEPIVHELVAGAIRRGDAAVSLRILLRPGWARIELAGAVDGERTSAEFSWPDPKGAT